MALSAGRCGLAAATFALVARPCDCGATSSAMTRQDVRLSRAEWAKPAEEHPKYGSQWFHEQRVDHFNPDDTRTWKQRFITNFDHYEAGGPIFLSISGESPLTVGDVTDYMVGSWLADQMHGGVIAVEHRFYGQSQPFDSLADEHLKFLTSRQALHDLANLQRWFQKEHSLETVPVFCLGGSYSGNLASWYRLEFPDLTAGCWSASAPVKAKEDWPGYGQMVWKAVGTDIVGNHEDTIPIKLYAGYERMAAIIQDSCPETTAWIKKEFNICPGTLVAQQDRDSLESMICTAPANVMQYNNSKGPKLAELRKIVDEAETPLGAVLAVSKWLNLTQGSGRDNCTDYSIGSMYKGLYDATLPKNGNGNADRTWTWQTCNEFGYFQKGTASVKNATMYTRGTSSPSMYQQVCSDVFGIERDDIQMNIDLTNMYYGGQEPRDISHVFYTNGNLDAWSLLGINSYPENDREVYAMVGEQGSHCVGLYYPREDEVPAATKIRTEGLRLFKRWAAAHSVAAQQMNTMFT